VGSQRLTALAMAWPHFNAVTKMKHEQAQVSHYGFTSYAKCKEHSVNYSVHMPTYDANWSSDLVAGFA
jgi:hypothetical protein